MTYARFTRVVTAAVGIRNRLGDANAAAAWTLVEDALRLYGDGTTSKRRPEYCTETYGFPCTMPLCVYHGDALDAEVST